jgi:hypothetical protein
MGANRNSPFFYSRVKGELEADLAALAERRRFYARSGSAVPDRSPRPLIQYL